MAAVRHRRLINWLSMAVALQLSVALVALSARAGRDIGPGAETRLSVGHAQDGSVLAGAKIPKRRSANRREAQGVPGASVTTSLAGGVAVPGGSLSPPVGGPATIAAPAPTDTTAAPHPRTLVDPSGDTVVEGSGEPAIDPRADIVRTGAVVGPDGVTFAMQVERPTDPRTDERWASESTYAQWDVDINGDATPDFELEYYFVDEDNLGGTVSNFGEGRGSVCNIRTATYGADGYKLTIDPECLGNAASFSYRAAMYYDTNPADENADVVTDVTPNGGWSFANSRLS